MAAWFPAAKQMSQLTGKLLAYARGGMFVSPQKIALKALCSLAEDTLRRLFEPFFFEKFDGSGLSKASESGIIKQHRGWIEVSSRLGQATCVRVYLPKA